MWDELNDEDGEFEGQITAEITRKKNGMVEVALSIPDEMLPAWIDQDKLVRRLQRAVDRMPAAPRSVILQRVGQLLQGELMQMKLARMN